MIGLRAFDPLWIGGASLAVLIGVVLLWHFFRAGIAQERSSEHLAQAPAVALEVPMVAIGDLRSECARRRVAWSQERDRIRVESARLSQLHFPEMQPAELLRHATPAERANLALILGASSEDSPLALEQAIRKAGSHTVMSLIRNGHVAYAEVARDVANEVGVEKVSKEQPIATIERMTVEALMNQRLAAASPGERNAVLAQLGRNGTAISAATAAGGLAVANLSGFALYTAASSALAGISGALGLTLPFAAYTGMSSVLATFIGPLGWATLGLFIAVKAGGPDYKKTVPSVLAIATTRARLIAHHQEASVKLQSESARNNVEDQRLDRLEMFIRQYADQPATVSVPRSAVPR